MRYFYFLFLFIISIKAKTQNLKSEYYQPFPQSLLPLYSDDLPEFVKMTLRPYPNFKAIEAAFEIFEKEEKEEKAKKRKNMSPMRHQANGMTEGVQSIDTQMETEVENIHEVYYHRWCKAYEPYVQDDGSIVLPTIDTYKQRIQDANRHVKYQLSTRSSNWTNVGPKETNWLKNNNAAQPAAPWQVNIYAFDIAKSNTSVLYACPETGGVFKTTDKGLNWTECTPNINLGGTASSIEIHPTDPNTVYVSINAFLWKTIDGGTTWTDLTNCTATDVNDIAISPTDPNIIIVAADNGLFRTTDGGTTWTQLYTDACYDIEINPTDASHIFILKLNGTVLDFYKSTDSGASFTLKTTGISSLTKGRLAVTAANGNNIYALCTSSPNPPKLLRSADEGETWIALSPTFCTGGVSDAAGGQGYYDLSIAVSQTDANQLLFGLCTTLKAVSTDGGATFTYTNIGGYCGSFAIHPDLQEVKSIMNGTSMETWIATDGGLTYSTDFFTSTSNAVARNNGIYSTDFWGFSQGWNEDIMVGGRYHNGNTAMADFYPSGKALRMGGAEAGTGYVLHGNSRNVVFSDLGPVWVLPSSFYENASNTSNYTKFPNEDGYGFNSTPLVIHPNYYKHQFLGEGNSLWKTTDNGLTFVALKDFGSRVRRFEVSRSNPSVIYLATDAGFNKSTDGGTTWATVALPSGKSSGNLYLSINHTNDEDVWIAFKNVSGSGKVYQTTNGGSSWTNMDGTVLGSLKIKNIVHTGSGVYIAADANKGQVFYRANSAIDWTDFSTNLPVSMNILKMSPFYRDGKLRVAGNRGVWESALSESVPPLAMPMVDKNSSNCIRDTFYFDDYSILKHPTSPSSPIWTWSFSPTPQYVSNANARNPKVVFGAEGNFTVTLTVNDGTATNIKSVTNMINITADANCEVSTVIGKAMSNTTNGDYLQTTSLNLNKTDGSNTNEITIMAWIKPDGIQSSYAGILTCNGVNINLNLRNNNELGVHWNDEGASYNWSSGLTVPINEWSHVAFVVTPTAFKLYLNGKEATRTYSVVTLNLASKSWFIGNDRGNSSRTFIGLIDEVCLFNRSLGINEIREKMHLMKTPASDASLKGYFQFDESSGVVWNKSLISNSSFVGTATRTTSSAPVALGTSQRMSITTGGVKDFTGTNCQMDFPASGTYPNGDLVVSALTAAPDQYTTSGYPLSNKYWVVNNYGTNSTFSALTSISFSNLGGFAAIAPASNYTLFKRKSNDIGATWGASIDNADVLTTANNNTLTFSTGNNITSFSQFSMSSSVALPIELLDFQAILNSQIVNLKWQLADEKDVHHYEIERSDDAKTFVFLKKQIKGQFSLIDNTPQYGINYYRLKIVENDGTINYSPIRSVVFEPKQRTEFDVFPNPTDDILNIKFISNEAQIVDFELINIVGQVVYTYRLNSKVGSNLMFFQTNNLPAGTYSLKIKEGNLWVIKKIIKN